MEDAGQEEARWAVGGDSFVEGNVSILKHKIFLMTFIQGAHMQGVLENILQGTIALEPRSQTVDSINMFNRS